jgi:uncharacterized protein YjbI with pentapeptide repeats
MKTIISKVLLGAMFAFASMAAHAVCTDPPAPFVNWAGCAPLSKSMQPLTLFGANLVGGDFSGLRLREAQLAFVHAARANFTNVDFSGANLRNANFFGANITGARWDDANLNGATWIDGTICGSTLGRCH